MLEVIPRTLAVTKSRILWSPPHPAIFVGFLFALCLCSSILYFFLLNLKVLSISGSGSYKIGLHIDRKDSYKHYHQHYQHNQTKK